MIYLLKNSLKKIFPLFLLNFIRRFIKNENTTRFVGPYKSWLSALNESTSYEDQLILNKVLESTLLVKSGEAVFERDSVLFDKAHYSWHLIATLSRAALLNGYLSVLDFGGSLGSSYFQNAKFLKEMNSVRWSVIEQNHFVNVGRDLIQNERLIFYSNTLECLSLEKPNVLLLSSVLQYLENPYEKIVELISFKPAFIIIDRTPFNDFDVIKDMVLKQIVPSSIYEASYPMWVFSRNKLMSILLDNYDVEYDEPSEEGVIQISNNSFCFRCIILKAKNHEK